MSTGFRVGVQAGDGIVARFGSTVIVADASTGLESFTNVVLAELDSSSATAEDIAWRVAELLVANRADAPSFGLVIGREDGFQLLLHGAVRALVGDSELTGHGALTWLDHNVSDPGVTLAVTLAAEGTVQADPRTDLRLGLVPGNGLVLMPASMPAHAAPVARAAAPNLTKPTVTAEVDPEPTAAMATPFEDDDAPSLVLEPPSLVAMAPAAEGPLSDLAPLSEPSADEASAEEAPPADVTPADETPADGAGPEQPAADGAAPDEVATPQMPPDPASESAPDPASGSAPDPASESAPDTASEPVAEPAAWTPPPAPSEPVLPVHPQSAPTMGVPTVSAPAAPFDPRSATTTAFGASAVLDALAAGGAGGAGPSEPAQLAAPSQPAALSQLAALSQPAAPSGPTGSPALGATADVPRYVPDTVALTETLSGLLSDDGTRIPLDRSYVFGRDPQQAPSVANGNASPIRLDDAEHLISRVQAYLFVDEHGVRVQDAGSANGTFIAAPGAADWDRLGESVAPLPVGWSLRMGRRVFTHFSVGP